ncbi:MAG TPA: tripartite tricarboxylate transporter TctB family protein [Paracoccaceae bacterium]|nr:tripartite tricarboxylate transporter TctB family protein [Paracoccaceae bacterium]
MATRAGRPDLPALAVGVVLLGLAGLVVEDALGIAVTPVYGIGPRATPYLVAFMLGILGLGHVVAAFREGLPLPERADWAAVTLILGALALLALSLWIGGGIVLAGAVLFALVARALASRNLATDLALGLALTLGFYLLFAKVLALTLPEGPVERLF